MRKILSLLLAAVLLISALPITVSAAEVDDAAEVGASYGLWIGSTQVTDANKNDILGDGGKAKFDPSTDTLTLNNPTITGEHNESTIFCNGFDLTVKGSYTMTAAQSDNALTVFDYGLTLDGNFTFLAWCYAVEVSNDINVNGGRVIAKLEDSAYAQNIAFCSNVGNLIFGDNVEYFEAEITDTGRTSCAISYDTDGTVTVGSNLKLTDPEGGRFRDGACVYTEGTKQKWAKRVVLASTSAHLGGTVGTINWEYDPAEKVFQAVGSGVFDRDADYNGYLDSAKSIKIGSGVTEIADDVIRDNNNVQKAVLASTIEKLGRNNFSNCPNLSEINFPDSLHYIMSGCFSGSGLQQVDIPNSVYRIDDGSFSNMPNLAKVTFACNDPSVIVPTISYISSMIVGDDCFSHLPMMQTLLFGDGPAYIGERSFCDMPELTLMTHKSLENEGVIGSRFSANLAHIGDGSFNDLPKAHGNPNYAKIDHYVPCTYLVTHYIGKKSIGYINGQPTETWFLDSEAGSTGVRYNHANFEINPTNHPNPLLPNNNYDSYGLKKFTDRTDYSARKLQFGQYYANMIQSYITDPLHIWTLGNDLDADIDWSAKVDNRDLILLKRYLAGMGYKDYLETWPTPTSNNCDSTGLKLKVENAADSEMSNVIRVPVTSVQNNGYISGSVTAKWNADALELIGIEYNDNLAPDNGTPEIKTKRTYSLSFETTLNKVDVDYSGEQVIRFGDDYKTTNYTGTGTMFTLLFKAKVGAIASSSYEVTLKNLEIVNAALEEPEVELISSGEVYLTNPGNYSVYDLVVGNTQVTSDNKDDILGDGKASFDPETNTLILNNPTIKGKFSATGNNEVDHSCKIFCRDMDLTVKGSYAMSTEDADYGIWSEGSFVNLNLDGDFTFRGTQVAVNVPVGFLNVTSGGLFALSTDGDGIHCVKLTMTNNARIEAIGKFVAIFYQIAPDFGANVRVTIPAGGSVKNDGVYESDGTTIASHALLDATNKPSYTVTYDTNGRGVAPVVQYVISGETVSKPADPTFEGWEFLGWYTNKACTAAFDYSTKITKNLTLYAKWSPLASTLFDLWVGSTQVTGMNYTDILGDGKASFDPLTSTLTLNNPTISSVYRVIPDPEHDHRSVTCKIFSNDIDLTVKGNYTMTDEDAQYGIYLYGLFHNLTFSGSFSFKGKNLAVNNEYGFLTVSSGSLTATSASGDGIYCAKLIAAADTRIEAKGGRSVAIYYQNSPELDAGLKLTTPAGGSIKDNGIYESDGTTIAKHVVIGKIGAAILGDVDGNGRVTIKDVLWIQRKIADMDLPFEFDIKRADVDGDGKITINDATAIQYYLAEMKTSYPIGETKS